MKTTLRRIASAAAIGGALLAPSTSQALILDWLLPGIIIGGPLPSPLPCVTGVTCVAPWSLWNHTPLAIGSTLNFGSDISNVSFSLGAGLSGQYLLTLTPAFDKLGSNGTVDELQLILANQQQQLATSQHGQLAFNATPTEQYYLMLNGAARQGQAYQLNLAAVPEPEAWGMLLAGLGVVGVALKRRRRNPLPQK